MIIRLSCLSEEYHGLKYCKIVFRIVRYPEKIFPTMRASHLGSGPKLLLLTGNGSSNINKITVVQGQSNEFRSSKESVQ